jgi:hypothetical protein
MRYEVRQQDGKWTTNMVSTHDFGEIVLTEDEDIVGLRFRDTKDADSGFQESTNHVPNRISIINHQDSLAQLGGGRSYVLLFVLRHATGCQR